MPQQLIFLTIPGLRGKDLATMPHLSGIADRGASATLTHHFPAVTWPSQANMLTGKLPREHGVVANGFYWRDRNEVEMWTAWNEVITQPQWWDRHPAAKTNNESDFVSAAWFPMLSKGCGAEVVCMPAPIHRPDGSEDLWCYTKPQEFYGQLLEEFGHFPLQHFWGPAANIKSTQWIARSAIRAYEKFQPNLMYVYLPHLDYAAQKFGPDSEQAVQSTRELDEVVGEFLSGISAISSSEPDWLVASEYVIQPVDHVTFPNRVLRENNLLRVVVDQDGRELIDRQASAAWALVDHQVGHVFVKDREPHTLEMVRSLFAQVQGIEAVLTGEQRGPLNHDRSGDAVLLSSSNSWQAYYWWNDDQQAPEFARTVDIHQKPGYDPVELFWDPNAKCVPLDAGLVRGSHGATRADEDLGGVLLSSNSQILDGRQQFQDVEIYDLVMSQYADA